ncbi:uncharacterized protein CC84DRAFT_1089873 [Paraphaeosphaeria sporulosa]|uniref:2EXR domain-containing protein n=1 Tax=Paraphaeosphaeria sporulosa TaxID=1460663 RepID=A0A177CHS8_9PLEO|nr:uncharacterized protein CC84DRAFT_1089873 [Paraphaeosphaeria sporulosa]OAG06781.1 hypothetical protein CC84DRAFT_1089873 [Paraphaeosphaeria sporulosa]
MSGHDKLAGVPGKPVSISVYTSTTKPLEPPPGSAQQIFTKSLIHEQYLRAFVKLLTCWASNHDSSAQFHGKIGVLASPNTNETYELGKSVNCVLKHTDYPKVRKHIVVRLFPPREECRKYALVVRSGSGWMSARDFFNKEHCLMLRAEARISTATKPYGKTISRREELAREAEPRNTVSIGPVFHQFLKLPQEIQDIIWVTAAGLTGMFRPCRHRTSDVPVPHIHENFYPRPNSPITISTMLRVCKSVNAHMAPWIYRTTRFQFELTGFTNFLWISGPVNRTNLRRVTFKFSSLALLHCLRWLSPDPVFMLFDPPAFTSPHGLQYFWRCQIQDLARELNLHTLTLDLQGVEPDHVHMVVRILRRAFGSVKYVRFVEDGKDICEGHWQLQGLRERKSWRTMCREWFEAHRANGGYMSDERRWKSLEELDKDMDAKRDFFDSFDDWQGVQTP